MFNSFVSESFTLVQYWTVAKSRGKIGLGLYVTEIITVSFTSQAAFILLLSHMHEDKMFSMWNYCCKLKRCWLLCRFWGMSSPCKTVFTSYCFIYSEYQNVTKAKHKDVRHIQSKRKVVSDRSACYIKVKTKIFFLCSVTFTISAEMYLRSAQHFELIPKNTLQPSRWPWGAG